MKFEIGIAIAIGWFILRTVSRALKKNKANLQSGGQNSNNSTQVLQNFVDKEAFIAQQQAMNADTEARSLERIVEETSRNIIDPFLEPRSMEVNPYNHYNEENLVAEYVQTHAEGKTVAHHKHQLFEAEKDRQKATRHTTYAGKPASARLHTHIPAPSRTKRAERKLQPIHPVAAAMKGRAGRKQAFILSEVLRRPEF
jgi:hypothetical protein